jgi:hypothetical protein
VGNVLIRPVEPHKIQTQEPHLQRLVMAGNDRVGQLSKPLLTVVTLRTLTGGFRVIKATLDDLCRRTRGARNAVGPAQLADGLLTLHIIDEILHVDLHSWTPVRVRGMRCRQYTPSSNATTPESNKSDVRYGLCRGAFTKLRREDDGMFGVGTKRKRPGVCRYTGSLTTAYLRNM